MSCEICLHDSTVETVLWKCVGCSRTFHAACVGVSVQRCSLRKKDRKADVQSYVLPCCSSCQSLITLNFEVQLLTKQQAELAEKVNDNTEVTHRATQQNNPTVVQDGIDRLEGMLTNIQKELTAIRNSGSAGTKNHITSLCDIAMQKSKENLTTLIQSMTSDITNDLKCLKDDIEKISSTTEGLAVGAAMPQNPMFEVDILDELKSLSANINSIESKIICRSPDSADSLENELNAINNLQSTSAPLEINNIQPVDQSGWRLLGTRNVWRADWTNYDKRKLHRLKQQKQAENARKRKKQARNGNSNNTHHRSHTSRPTNFQYNRYNHHVNTSYNNDGALNIMRGHSGSSLLPPDRILLAAAKEKFSKPPRSSSDAPITHRPIQFQSGEILNPYPTHEEFPRSTTSRQPNWMSPGCSANSATPCEACQAQHSCFRRN